MPSQPSAHRGLRVRGRGGGKTVRYRIPCSGALLTAQEKPRADPAPRPLPHHSRGCCPGWGSAGTGAAPLGSSRRRAPCCPKAAAGGQQGARRWRRRGVGPIGRRVRVPLAVSIGIFPVKAKKRVSREEGSCEERKKTGKSAAGRVCQPLCLGR